MFKPALRVLASLQEDLCAIDVSVALAKRKYDAAMKTLLSKKKKDDPADLRKVMNSVQFARNDYLLELACANKLYLKFRNEQIPEVLDVRCSLCVFVFAYVCVCVCLASVYFFCFFLLPRLPPWLIPLLLLIHTLLSLTRRSRR
jgi:hypothetical protein